MQHAFLRFVVTGVLATLTHIAVVFSLAHLFLLTAGAANFVASILATLVSYTLNSMWSFKSSMTKQNAIRFASVAGGCAVLAAILAELVSRAGHGLLTGIFTCVVVITPISFLMHRNWTYKAR